MKARCGTCGSIWEIDQAEGKVVADLIECPLCLRPDEEDVA